MKPAELAKLARQCATKKELATHLKGPDLAEAWRIKQIQNERVKLRRDPDYDPRPVDEWEINEGRPGGSLIWPFAANYAYSFSSKIAAKIKSGWAYGKYRWHEYTVSVHHSFTVGAENRHAGSGCVDYPVDIGFDLLRQEAVWIGGLLTILAKSDKGKTTYPCWWFERRKSDPHLHLRQGRITRRNHHEEDSEAREQRLAPARLKRALKGAKPPKGWVTEETAVKAGNCRAGVRNFIHHSLIPRLRADGATVGDLTGAAVRKSLVLEIRRDGFTARL